MATKKNDEVVPQGSNLPAVSYDYGTMSGTGFEGATQDDFVMPFLNLLQPMSPEVSNNPAARPGMLINSVTKQLYDGKTGLIFVPCARQHVFVEWKPRDQGGGIVARHEPTSDVVIEAKSKSKAFGQYSTEHGNDLIETFYLVGYMLDGPDDEEPNGLIVVPFWSTKIKTYKRVMQMLNTFKGRPPLFANRLRVTSQQEKNQSGTFFNFNIVPVNGGVGESLIPPKHPLLTYGMQLNKQVQSGERRMADESVTESSDTNTDMPF
jgi:hypothetical protein